MLAVPGSLLWLFLLVYFSSGQILDTPSLDASNISTKGSDELVEPVNHTKVRHDEEEKENKITEVESKVRNEKSNLQDSNQLNLSINETLPKDSLQESDKTPVAVSERNHLRRVPNRTITASNATEIPTMSQERRNSYLSIAERRKYYNRTRVQTKKPQINEVEQERQEATTKPVISSTSETVHLNEIGVVKKSDAKDSSSREVTTEKIETNNQRLFVNFSSNGTQGKPQTIRQSVIQSQYQFGQKLNLRKSISRTQDASEEKLRRKKEKGKMDSNMENSTNKANKNYPTQSTKLIRVEKNLWTTTTIPQSWAAVNENETFPKPSDRLTTNNTENENVDEPNQNEAKIPQAESLPAANKNATVGRNSNKNISDHEEKLSRVIHGISQFNISKPRLVETSQLNSTKHLFVVNKTLNHIDSLPSTTESLFNVSDALSTAKATTLLKLLSNTTLASLNAKSKKLAVTPSIFPKPNSEANIHEDLQITTPLVKVISKDSSNFTPKTKSAQSETHLPKNSYSSVKPEEKNKSFVLGGVETWNKTEEYPLTIELNENNKRVLSEMFQTMTTSTPKNEVQESTLSQPNLPVGSINRSSTESSTVQVSKSSPSPSQRRTTPASTDTLITNQIPGFVEGENNPEEDHKAQGTRYNTKFYISPKFNGTKVIKVVEEDDENDEDVDAQSQSAGVAIYVLAAFGLVPLLLALIFGAKFMMQRNQREYECESDAKSDLSANDSQLKDGKKKKGSTDLKKSPSNVTTITLVTGTRLPRIQHWENSEKQGNRNWEFPRSKLKLKTILGQGNFGQVWKAEAEDMPGHEGVTRLVAVKTVKEGATEKEHTEFIKELEIMQQIGSHPNIVTLLGCCTDQEPYYLIMEYVKCGKLLTYLREHRVSENYYNFSNNSDALTSRDLTVFAYCVARGMEYLASRGIIHRDLAARNVLVDHNKMCKIADFGMSRSVRDFENGQVYEERQQKGALPIRWMAPESLVYSVFTYKSDVWSFGIVMWEIVTLGSTPYPNMGAREVMRKVRDGYRLERPSHCKPEFYQLISYCWAHDPNKRPDFSELRHELSNLLDNPTRDGSYVDLDRFAVDNSFPASSKTSDFRLLERNDFKTLQKLGDWNRKDWPDDVNKLRMKRGRNNGKGTITLTGQGSFTVNSRILEKEFKII